MEIKDMMSKKLVIGDVDSSIGKIAKLMKKYDIGFIPIAKGDKIVGVITDRDIVTKALANDAENNSSVSKYMTNNLIICDINTSTSDVLKVMRKNKIKRVLIAQNNMLVGIIALSDIKEEPNEVLEAFKIIWEIKRNSDYFDAEVKNYYL